MLLKTICMLDVACCSPRTTVLEAAHLMRQKHTGDLVVIDDGGENQAAPLGVITDRDIVIEVLGKGLDPSITLVNTVMRTPVVIANQGEDTSDALERMTIHGVRRLPVVNDRGALIGIVTVDDLLKRLATDATALVNVISREQIHESHARR